MGIIIVLAVIFVLMMAGPIAFAAVYYKRHQSTVLHINQDRVRDPRYFGKFFANMVQSRLPEIEEDVIHLSRDEIFFDADSAKEDDYREEFPWMVIAREQDFLPPEAAKYFRKEIYSGKNASILHEGTKLRAAYSKQNMILGNGIQVVRWADAEETLAIYDNCDLGISVSAGELLSIGYGCAFQRMYAPEIRIGQYPDSSLHPAAGKDPRIYRLPIQVSKEKNMRYISKEMINEEGIVDNSVLSWRNLTIIEKIIVQGDVRSQKSVRLCDDAVVCGNIFAEGDILLGKNTAVLGNIFCQGSIVLEERATVGQQGRICSVIAREHITFHGENFVFGYVSSERGGRVLPCPMQQERPAPQYQYLSKPDLVQHLRFKNLPDYENIDQQGFRKNKGLEDVIVPRGAVRIPRSMFFSCRKLKWAQLPPEIEKIDDFAFADCGELKEICGFEDTSLEYVGTSAFENCKRLTGMRFPKTVRTLEGAAFAGCEGLQWVEFLPGAVLEKIGDHCFRDCTALQEMVIPDSVMYLGMSAFRGCSALKRLSLPERFRESKELQGLKEQGAELIFRAAPEERVKD